MCIRDRSITWDAAIPYAGMDMKTAQWNPETFETFFDKVCAEFPTDKAPIAPTLRPPGFYEILGAKGIIMSNTGTMPVSYTHLDVYKRQGMNEYPENVSALQDLGIGRIDAVIVDSVVARYYISSENADYIILDESLSPETYAVAVKKGNTELQGKIQKAIDDMVADGTAAEISKKWFGEDIFYTGN